MKILKKIGIVCLALIICLCSCFKSVDAYSFTNFVVPYTSPGTTYMQPLINCNLSFVIYSSDNATHYLYPLTPYNYVNSSNNNQEVNSYYDLEFEKHYSFVLNATIYTQPISRYLDGEMKRIDYSYKDGITRYYNIDYSERNVNEIVIDYDYNSLYLRDVASAIAHLYFPTDLSIIGDYSVEYYFEYFANGQLQTTTRSFTYQIDTSNEDHMTISPWFTTDTNDEDYDFLYDVQPTRIRAKITSENIDLSLINKIDFSTRYVDVVNYANIFGLVSRTTSTIIEAPNVDGVDFTGWLTNSVNSFMNLEIFPNFKLGSILGVIVSIPLLIYILKLFLGG